MKIPVARIKVQNDQDLLSVRRHARLISQAAGLPVRDQTRMITALSEIARNAVEYGGGGHVDFVLRRETGENLAEARVYDEGPGIRDVDHVLNERFVDRVGRGLGVAGSRRLVHRFVVETSPAGTSITLGMRMPPGDEQRLEDAARDAIEALAQSASDNPHEELVRQNRALVESLAEKDFLIREIHHRVKNNFQLISSLARLQARRAQGAEARTLLESLSMRIRALGLAHEQLYRFDDLSQVGLKAFVTQLCTSLQATFVGPDQDIRITCMMHDDITLTQDEAMDLGIIVNELVTNAIRHGFPDSARGEVNVESETLDNAFALIVRDNGISSTRFAEDGVDGESLGIRLVRSSVRKLDGDIEFLSSDDGTAVRVTLPRISTARAFQSVI